MNSKEKRNTEIEKNVPPVGTYDVQSYIVIKNYNLNRVRVQNGLYNTVGNKIFKRGQI